MESCFRFLINVDQCLNMSNFDMFFYKLESQQKFHMNNVRLFGDSFDASLRNAALEIRAHLDRYPYHLNKCHVVVAMRGERKAGDLRWEDTLLYRLVQVEHELRRVRVFIGPDEQTEKALSLIMLYDVDLPMKKVNSDGYKASERFFRDCALLLQNVGIENAETATLEDVETALAAYERQEQADPAITEFVAHFCRMKNRLKAVDLAKEHEEALLWENEAQDDAVLMEFVLFLREQMANVQVLEAQLDRNNRRQNILSLLRVVEFINTCDEGGESEPGGAKESLAQRCVRNWGKVWADSELEARYADMLCAYQRKLKQAAIELERSPNRVMTLWELPKEEIPADKSITSDVGSFANSDQADRGRDLRAILDRFIVRRVSLKTVAQEWSDAHQKIESAVDRMDRELRSYAEDLSHRYVENLEQRKQRTLPWSIETFSGTDVENRAVKMQHERKDRLQKLKSPHMTPSLSFQDQLNMENVLRQTNLTMEYYLRCISTINLVNFLAVVGVCLLWTVAHYSTTQPYVFMSATSTGQYLLYILVVLAAMLLCWGLPYAFFRRKIRKCIKVLRESMDQYIRGYFEKGGYFQEYINLLNQLDYVNRYCRLLQRTQKSMQRRAAGYRWHKVKLQEHLSKLTFFQGLITLSDDGSENWTEEPLNDSLLVVGEKVVDVVDSPLYWPQE